MDRIIKMSCALGCCALLFSTIAFATGAQETAQTTIEAAVTTTQSSGAVESVTVSSDANVESEQVTNAQSDEQVTQAQVVTTTQEVEQTTTQEVELVEETTQAIVQVSEKAEDVAQEETVQEETDVQDSIITIEKDETEVEIEEIEAAVESVIDEVLASVSGSTGETLVLAETNSSTPSKVTSLKFSQSHNDEVTIYWPSASNATGYEVYFSDDGGETFTLHQKTSATSYVCSDLDSTTDYQFKIVAYNGTVYGEYSNVFSYTIESTNGIYNIDATNITDTTATITWDAVEGATYKVEMKGTYTWGTVKSGVTSNSYDLTELSAGSDVLIRVSAYVNGSYGDTVEFTFKTVVGTVALEVSSSQTDEISFEWSEIAGATSYEVYVAIDSGDFKLVDTTTSESYNLDRDENSTYQIKVRAIDESGDQTVYGAFSEVISVAGLLGAVTNLEAEASADSDKGYKTFTLSWDAVDGAEKYNIYYYYSYGNYWKKYGDTTGTSLNVTTNYTTPVSIIYKVSAVDSEGIPGVDSEPIMAMSEGVSISFSTTKTTITWPAVTSANSYVVSLKSLDGLTYSEQVTSQTNSATLYLPADSIVTLKIEAYNGDTKLSTVSTEIQVVTAELYLYSPSDDYDLQLSSLRSELIYFTQVINNTKYYDGDVEVVSEAIFSMTASDFKLDGEDVTDMIESFDVDLDDFGEETTETNTYSFSEGLAKDDSGRTIELDNSFVPFENDAYLYNAQDDSVRLASYISLTTIWNNDEHYITENADGTYSITFTIYTEQNSELYHSGFTTVFGNDDLGDDSFAITDSQYGATTINATFTDDGYLLTLEVISPFVFSATASLTGDSSSLGNLSMKMSGTTTYKYTFIYE